MIILMANCLARMLLETKATTIGTTLQAIAMHSVLRLSVKIMIRSTQEGFFMEETVKVF